MPGEPHEMAATWTSDAIFLTPFAAAFRYPDISSMEPERDDVASAIQSAERILEISVKKTAGDGE